MYQDYADFALKYLKKSKVQYGEVRLEEHDGSSFLLKNSVLEGSGFDRSSGMGIRFLLNNALGFVSINDFDKTKIRVNIDKALKLVRKGGKLNETVHLSDEKSHKKNYKVKQKIKLKDISPTKKVNLLRDLDSDIKNAMGRYLNYGDVVTKKYFVNTEGTNVVSEIPRVNFMYFITVKEGSKSGQKYWQYCNSGGWDFVKKWKLNELLKGEYAAIRNNLKNAKKAPNGELDVVVGPEVTGIMVHESVGHPFEADRIFGREAAQAGESFVHENMIGDMIGNEIVTVVDDPLVENSAGHYEYDDEGVRARKRVLIRNGKINEFLHNRETAAEMKICSNGAARAESYDKEAIVRMANTFLLPGDHKEEELIEGIKKGIYMKDFTEWNIDDKRYQMKYVGNDAYYVENGKIKHPIIKPVLELTTPVLWKSVDALGKNIEYHTGTCGKGEPMQGVPAFLGGPSMRLRKVRLG